MTRKQLAVVMAWGLVGVLCLTASAAPTDKDKAPTTQPQVDEMEQAHKALLVDLKLPDKQAAAVGEILADYRKDLSAWTAKTAPEVKRLNMQLKMYHRVKQPKALAAVRAAASRLAQIRTERQKKLTTLVAQLKGALTKSQMAKAEEALGPKRPVEATPSKFHLLSKLGLAEPQKAKLKIIMDELRTAQKAPRARRAKGNPSQKAWTRIIGEVLTLANQKELRGLMQEAKFRRMSRMMLGDVELTPRQLARIDTIWKEAHKKALASPKDKFAIYGAAQGEIIDEVLTDLQRKEMSSRKRGGGPKVRM